jgi:hypothetical protein
MQPKPTCFVLASAGQCYARINLTSAYVAACVQIEERRESYLSEVFDTDQTARPSTHSVVLKVGHATTLVALAVPVALLSFSDTGLLFSLVGAALSAFEGFQKGVGSLK